jgi:hypothetical protein
MNLAVHGHSFIQAIKTSKIYLDTYEFYSWPIGIFLLLAIWRCGQSGMFFSNIIILHQCGLYGAASNSQEITILVTVKAADLILYLF